MVTNSEKSLIKTAGILLMATNSEWPWSMKKAVVMPGLELETRTLEYSAYCPQSPTSVVVSEEHLADLHCVTSCD